MLYNKESHNRKSRISVYMIAEGNYIENSTTKKMDQKKTSSNFILSAVLYFLYFKFASGCSFIFFVMLHLYK